ncbi:hypothetical protein SKAU_G00317160 [Synaphobranchus kaupii]|uniref:Uncharacterized protein n=1 Tax=Synaphobranchus kaupii TaxID=118154 RepID=A0A9Q1ESX9_SYNKA|nr:hypothetical protein SKAU_G00317160 [Synaphobranchus kaupii]
MFAPVSAPRKTVILRKPAESSSSTENKMQNNRCGLRITSERFHVTDHRDCGEERIPPLPLYSSEGWGRDVEDQLVKKK